jgi:hypothetical protein
LVAPIGKAKGFIYPAASSPAGNIPSFREPLIDLFKRLDPRFACTALGDARDNAQKRRAFSLPQN